MAFSGEEATTLAVMSGTHGETWAGRESQVVASFPARGEDRRGARFRRNLHPPDLTFGGCHTTWTCNTIEDNH